MPLKTIILSDNLTPEDQGMLISVLEKGDEFIQKKEIRIGGNGVNFRIENNLILESKTNDKITYIEIDSNDVLGEGAYSKVRPALARIELDLTTKKLTYTQITDEAVKIFNPKKTFEKLKQENEKIRQENEKLKQQDKREMKSYDPQIAEKEYEQTKNFPHLAMHKPVVVTRHDHTKSYAQVKLLTGDDLCYALDDFHATKPSTLDMLTKVLLPILEAYEKQIAQQGYVHRDIKSLNVKADIPNGVINFMDINRAVKIGAPDSTFGSLGYLAPELLPTVFQSPTEIVAKVSNEATQLATEEVKAIEARDIYSLGVLLTECIDPDLSPDSYSMGCGAKTAEEAMVFMTQLIRLCGSYDPSQFPKDVDDLVQCFQNNPELKQEKHDSGKLKKELLQQYLEYYGDLFSKMNDAKFTNITAEQSKIKELLLEMTTVDPNKRPSIGLIIKKFKEIATDLSQKMVKTSEKENVSLVTSGNSLFTPTEGKKIEVGTPDSTPNQTPELKKKDFQ